MPFNPVADHSAIDCFVRRAIAAGSDRISIHVGRNTRSIRRSGPAILLNAASSDDIVKLVAEDVGALCYLLHGVKVWLRSYRRGSSTADASLRVAGPPEAPKAPKAPKALPGALPTITATERRALDYARSRPVLSALSKTALRTLRMQIRVQDSAPCALGPGWIVRVAAPNGWRWVGHSPGTYALRQGDPSLGQEALFIGPDAATILAPAPAPAPAPAASESAAPETPAPALEATAPKPAPGFYWQSIVLPRTQRPAETLPDDWGSHPVSISVDGPDGAWAPTGFSEGLILWRRLRYVHPGAADVDAGTGG